MSKRRDNLPNSKKDVLSFLEWVSRIPYVKSVMLHGSRSPLRNKEHTDFSDWDLILITSKDIVIPNLRDNNILHADVIYVTEENKHKLIYAVEIYPNDHHEILKCSEA